MSRHKRRRKLRGTIGVMIILTVAFNLAVIKVPLIIAVGGGILAGIFVAAMGYSPSQLWE